jgi:hypothetical protein
LTIFFSALITLKETNLQNNNVFENLFLSTGLGKTCQKVSGHGTISRRKIKIFLEARNKNY